MACLELLPFLRKACRLCALPLATGTLCGTCLHRPPRQTATIAAFRYGYPLDALVRRFKFQGDLAAGRVLSELFAERLYVRDIHSRNIEAIMPVPLHPKRLHERGFNQAEELARSISSVTGVPLYTKLLRRVRATEEQSGKSAVERRRNVRGAFQANCSRLPASIAIVDDVMTTGTTIGEITAVLGSAGVERVEAWVLARTP